MMNNNSPNKTNGYVRFATKKCTDDQDVGLIDDHNEFFDRSASTDQDAEKNNHHWHESHVTIGRVGSKVRQPETTSCKLKCFVFVSGATLIISMFLILHFYQNRPKMISIGDGTYGLARLCLSEKTLSVFDHERRTRAVIALGGDNFPSLKYEEALNCGLSRSTTSGMCLLWPSHGTKLSVTPVTIKKSTPKEAVQCYKVAWSYKPENVPEDCIYLDRVKEGRKLGHDVWFDTQDYVFWSEDPQQRPASAETMCEASCQKYTTGGASSATINPQKNLGGTVVEPLWLSSQSVIIKASLHNPLKACMKLCYNSSRSKLCLKTEAEESHQLQAHREEGVSNLTYVACFAHDTSMLYQEAASAFFSPSLKLGDEKALQDVINDGVYFEKTPKQKRTTIRRNGVLENCSQLLRKPLWNIVFNGKSYERSTIEAELNVIKTIGGTGYMVNVADILGNIGDFTLRENSRVKSLDVIQVLHKIGFGAMIPLTPFVNYDSENFRYVVAEGLLIRDEDAAAPILTVAPQFGSHVIPGILDFTNPNVSEWFRDNVVQMKLKYGIDFIHLFYGQATWLPKHYHLTNPLHNPSFYSTLYTDIGNSIGRCPVSDVAYSSQTDHQFVMLNAVKDLESTLKVALASGLAGYPFFIPNLPALLEQTGALTTEFIEDGFMRWIQLVSFFPVAHIPWDFHTLENLNVNITRLTTMIERCMSIRNGQTVWDAFENAINDAERSTGKPIVSPMWMAPNVPPMTANEFDWNIYNIQDQFMIGPDILFAPVVTVRQQKRDVYFPPGQWKNLLTGKAITMHGSPDGYWVNNVNVELESMLIYIRTSDENP